MVLILTHENSDFDAIASQLAAHRLYPEGTPLLSRRVNRNASQFLALYWDSLPFRRPDQWRRQRIEKVILVDTQSVPSIRGLRKEVQVTVIDHHAPAEAPPEWIMHIEPIGATTTLLVEMLQNRGYAPPAVEATLLLLGIYEDTGALTYDTTTPRDIRVAAWLLEQGAQLSVVRRFLDVPLTEGQLALYKELQLNARWLKVEGQAILIASAEAEPDFREEISAIAHRMRDALAPAGLILLVGFSHHVQMVARSTTEEVDVSVLARAMGGGGHGRAAAATIMNTGLRECEERIIALLSEAVRPAVRVADIMSRGVQTLDTESLVYQAAQQMQRFGHEGYPVIDRRTGKIAGLLTRQIVDRAVTHELERLRVGQVMKSGRVTVKPEDSVEVVQQLMISEGWGQIPVVQEAGDPAAPDELLGVVTRTDLLRLLSAPAKDEAGGNLRDQLAGLLPPAQWRLLQVISREADSAGMPIYFVGGIVRDLLLELPATDIDIVVEGDAIALVRRLAAEFGGRVRSHGRFGTAKWLLSADVWQQIAPGIAGADAIAAIDFVTARTEFYTEPTALPEVTHGSIKLDLHRRDFTINTLAIRLDGPHLGELLDFYGGLRDLESGLIRVLHSLSFIDDPTRIMRAVRLERRLNFAIESRTMELISDALPLLARVSGPRLRHEIELAFEELDPAPVYERLAELGVLAHIHPALGWERQLSQQLGYLRQLLDTPWREAMQGRLPTLVMFTIWMMSFAPDSRSDVMNRLRVRRSTIEVVEGAAKLLRRLSDLPENARPSLVERTIRPYAVQTQSLLAVRAAVGDSVAGDLLDRHWQEWRLVRTELDGHHLRQLGLKPGPQFASLLDQLLAARLDGQVVDEAGERALLDSLLAQQPAKDI